eukprot:GHRQ01040046.1.p2 GENE.GHRQ01040046.1~~GHRQ01040046.1.p2  ORF type:complete len:103 (-),score=5.40 GHRQ01040046.1:120-428(-)
MHSNQHPWASTVALCTACLPHLPRYLPPNFYYDMVDYVSARVAGGAGWTWSALLPNPVIGYSPGSYMNLLNAIAAYAAICKEMHLPFRCEHEVLPSNTTRIT